MANRYHIKEDGMPGACSAASVDSCPRAAAGDAFHGTRDEAIKEAETRFAEKLGAFATASKKNPAPPIATAEAEAYAHPQGKIAVVNEDGSVTVTKDGKVASSSVTLEKLRAGYGRWAKIERAATSPAPAAKPAGAKGAPSAAGITLSEITALRQELASSEKTVLKARDELNKQVAGFREYNNKNGVAEGRAYHTVYDRSNGYRAVRVPGPDANGKFYVDYTEDQQLSIAGLRRTLTDAEEARDNAYTQIERKGLGRYIPDTPKTLRVRTEAQKWLLEDELKGQFSDGMWENSGHNGWMDWSDTKVIVDPENPGVNYRPSYSSYNVNSSKLLDIVGDRMEDNVREKTGDKSYDRKAMRADLADLKKLMSLSRPPLKEQE